VLRGVSDTKHVRRVKYANNLRHISLIANDIRYGDCKTNKNTTIYGPARCYICNVIVFGEGRLRVQIYKIY